MLVMNNVCLPTCKSSKWLMQNNKSGLPGLILTLLLCVCVCVCVCDTESDLRYGWLGLACKTMHQYSLTLYMILATYNFTWSPQILFATIKVKWAIPLVW